MKKDCLLLVLIVLFNLTGCERPKAPEAYGPVPTEAQLKWQELERYAFIHFSMNTFTDMEWGYGDKDPQLFNPSELDCRQWCRLFKEAGMKGVILTAKHHDGFCLWPSAYTDYSVKQSPWRNGNGDLVRELADACKEYGLKLGIYLSPWDRNHKEYGTEAYITYFRNQLNELLTNYGDIFEVWFDGANGGSGYYGGADETRSVDRKTYYDWPGTNQLVKKLQPDAVIFSDAGPDVRWCGNEAGWVGETNWSTLRREEVWPGWPHYQQLQNGHEDGSYWVPAEVNVSIRPGWFYHQEEDSKVKSLKHLTDIYFQSVGYNSVLLLNIPPDRRGLINEADVTRLKEFAEYRKQTFADDRVKGGQKLWEAKPGEERIYKLKSGSEINVVMLQEDISKGQRVEEFSVEAHTADGWKEVGQGTTVGYKRMLRFPAVKTDRLKIKIKNCRLTANISKIAAFYAVPLQEEGETVDWNNLPRSAWKQVSASPLVIDLGSPVSLGAFTYAPAKAEAKPTMAFRYKFFVSLDGNNWKEVPSSGEFSNIMHNPLPQTVSFKEKVKARFIKLEATTPTDTPAVVEINEIGVTVNK